MPIREHQALGHLDSPMKPHQEWSRGHSRRGQVSVRLAKDVPRLLRLDSRAEQGVVEVRRHNTLTACQGKKSQSPGDRCGFAEHRLQNRPTNRIRNRRQIKQFCCLKIPLGAGLTAEERRVLRTMRLQAIRDVQQGLLPRRKPSFHPGACSEKEDEFTGLKQPPEALRIGVLRRISPSRGHRPTLFIKALSRQM